MYAIRTPALIAGAILVVMVLAITAGNALIASGLVKNQYAFETPAKIVFFTLFVLFGFSLIPLMVRLVLGFQVLIGNANVRPIRAAIDHANWIVAILWALMAAGLAAALPAAIAQGFFGDESSAGASQASAAAAIAKMPVEGTLVAAPGMQVREMLGDSTLRVRPGSQSPLFSGARFGGAALFDYRIAGTKTVFRRCRYYYITTYERRPDRIESINVGISAEKLTHLQLASAERALDGRLRADGWASRGGTAWRRRGIVLDVRSRRLDDAVPGEDPSRSGEWIQYIELRVRS
jgi:hypothetical protein